MKNKKIVKQILSSHPEISKENLFERLYKERDRTAGLIDDEVLLRMIAAELGMDTTKETVTPALSTENLTQGLNDVTVVGRVVAVFRPKTFNGQRPGKVGSLLIVDQSDLLRVVLWNEKADFIEEGKIKVGEVLRFSHGYTKKGYSGKVELHLGDRSEIDIHPEGIRDNDYPTINKFLTDIGEISKIQKNKKVNVRGIVENFSAVSEFERDNSSSGKVMRLRLADESGDIPVVIWNEKVDHIQKEIEGGEGLVIVNGKVRESSGGGVEIHINNRTYVEILKSTLEFRKIAELKEKLRHVNIEGEVISEPQFRKVNTHKGDQVKLTSFEMKDETGSIWVSAWRKHALTARELTSNQKVKIKNAYVKEGYTNRLELSTRSSTQIIPLPEKEQQENN